MDQGAWAIARRSLARRVCQAAPATRLLLQIPQRDRPLAAWPAVSPPQVSARAWLALARALPARLRAFSRTPAPHSAPLQLLQSRPACSPHYLSPARTIRRF